MVEIKIDYFDGIHPNVVHSPHGYWYNEKDIMEGWGKWNINILTDSQPADPNSASVPIKGFLCRIVKQ